MASGAAAAASVKRSVERARLRRLVGDLFLVIPLFLFLLIVFAVPIALFMYRAVDNDLLYRSFPNTPCRACRMGKPRAGPRSRPIRRSPPTSRPSPIRPHSPSSPAISIISRRAIAAC